MPHTLSPTKPIRAAVENGKPLAVFMPWPKVKPFRILTHGKPYRTKKGMRTKTLVKHARTHKLRRRVRAINRELDPIWGDPYEHFGLCGDVILDPDNIPAPHPNMSEYSWWEHHSLHDHEIYGQYTEQGDTPGINAPGRAEPAE